MADEAPLLDVRFDGSKLGWSQKYVAVFTQFFYWDGGSNGFADDIVLSPISPIAHVKSSTVRRPLTTPYLYFHVYLFLKPDANVVEDTIAAFTEISKLTANWSNLGTRLVKQLEAAIASGPLDYFISPFVLTNAASVQVLPALAVAKLSLTLFTDVELDGRKVKVKSAVVRMTFLNNANQAIQIIKQLADVPKLGITQTFHFDKDNLSEQVDIYRDDRNFFLFVEIVYALEPQEGLPATIVQPKLRVSPLLPAIYLRPDLKLYTLTYDAEKIDWDADNPVVLVLVVATLHDVPAVAAGDVGLLQFERSFPTVTLSGSGPAKILRSATVPAADTIGFHWKAYYYFETGSPIAIGSADNKPVYGDLLKLPPRPDSAPIGDWTPFVKGSKQLSTLEVA